MAAVSAMEAQDPE